MKIIMKHLFFCLKVMFIPHDMIHGTNGICACIDPMKINHM